MRNTPETVALVVAAGRGIRAENGELPKQYQSVGGKPLLLHSLRTLLEHPRVDAVRVVIGAQDRDRYGAVAPQHPKLGEPVTGGASRQESVRMGLNAIAASRPKRVLIHDAARPFLSAALVDRVTGALDGRDAVVPAVTVANTLKRINDAGDVIATVAREGLVAAETPQGFSFDAILAAHTKAAGSAEPFTDDAGVAEWAGIAVHAVPGAPGNVKLTTAADIAGADRRMLADEMLRLGDVRVGIGCDIHPLGSGSHVMLGGVNIPHTRGLVGHSDADVVLHALTDAILGAIGDGDIGEHFPSSDDKWKGASSDRFLADAAARVMRLGGVIAHLDVSFVAQGPKVAPHRMEMRQSIARICGIAVERVGVKATTNEGLGFIGRGEGAAAYAVATVRLPVSLP